MTIWERLGIEQTSDIKAIKKAYAKQLKVYHPEDDPAGYQALREAFDRALSIAKHTKFEEPDDYSEDDNEKHREDYGENYGYLQIDIEPDEEMEVISAPQRLPLLNLDDPDSITSKYTTISDFIAGAIELYDHFPSRISPEAWTELLNSNILWNLEAKKQIGEQLRLVLKNRKYIPMEIWSILDNFFGWEDQIQEQFQTSALRYKFLLQAEDIDIEQFLEKRDKGREALSKNELMDAENYLKQAYSLFPDDPDLMRLLGICYFRKMEYETAMSYFIRLTRLVPEEIDSYLYKAQIWYHTGHFHKGIEECQAILSRWPNQHEAIVLIRHCYMALDQKEKVIPFISTVSKKPANKPEKYARARSRATGKFVLRQLMLIILSIVLIIISSLSGVLFLTLIGLFLFFRGWFRLIRSFVRGY